MLQRQKERERQEWRNNPNTRSSSAEMVRRIFFFTRWCVALLTNHLGAKGLREEREKNAAPGCRGFKLQ
jgi:hypothetical protein